ncbi:MAG: protein kinase, partial [Chloroflexota bacterium]
MDELIGQTLGQYQIIEQIGRGGMATVYKAYQPSLERHVALKVLPPYHAARPGFSERFQREARAIATLNHPNILPAYDFGQTKDYSFIAMRHVENATTLKSVMADGPLTLIQMAEIIEQIAGALDTAHAQGMIHRDVNPSNVLMDGTWALLSDFGLVKIVAAPTDLTDSGVGIGTPSYMSPEQGQGQAVDHRTDIYALGVILFEMLTHRIPHEADTPFGIILNRTTEALALPRSLNPDIPTAVEAIVLKALATNPNHRYRTAGDMAEALGQAINQTADASPDLPSEAVERTDQSTYRIRLLGSLQIEKDGVPLPPLRTQKTSALLGYLARQTQPVSRSYLADLFWSETSEARGRRNLSNELSHITAQLPDLLETDRQAVRFQPSEQYWLDTTAFETAITTANEVYTTAHWAEAITLYRGDFMAGCQLNDCPEFDTWLHSEQAYWRQQVMQAFDRIVTDAITHGQDDQAQYYARRWLTLEPWSEAAHRHLMLVLARNGQRSAALAQYETCRHALEEELAVTPSPETEQLYEQIKVGAIGPPQHYVPGVPQQPITPPSQATPAPQVVEASPSPTRKNQLILLNKVKNFWVKGVLEQTLHETIQLELNRQLDPQAVEQPWRQIMEATEQDTQVLSSQTSMLELFQQSERALLILGTPGAGKTITLINLARELIALATYDASQPIPVILNLTSWGEQRQTLDDWIVEELTLKYQIPRKMGRDWLDNDDLLLLLDGFDEISLKHQPAGLEAINQFRESHGLAGIVVCSRAIAYEALPTKLRLGGSVRLLPLTLKQIEAYLITAGPQLDFLRVILNHEAQHGGNELRAVVESPLMLSVIRMAYDEDEVTDLFVNDDRRQRTRSEANLVLQANQDGETRRHNLFAAYVQRMLQRRGGASPDSAQDIEQRLAWLAQKMFQHNESIFLIEQLQPSWLPTRGQRWLYLLLTRAIGALALGVMVWALILFWLTYAPEVVAIIVNTMPVTGVFSIFITAILIALSLNLLASLFDGLYFEWARRHSDEDLSPWGRRTRHLITACVTGIIPATMIATLLPDSIGIALYWGVMSGVGMGISSYLTHGDSFEAEIQSVERLHWSWRDALTWAFLSLIPGIILQIVASQLEAAFVGVGALWVMTFALIGGAQGRTVETKTSPNQGMALAARNSLLAALIGGLSFGLVMWLSADIYNGIRLGLAGSAIWGSFYGGMTLVKHGVLRLLLWWNNDTPWHYATFLDIATERILLRKVGGGYILMGKHPRLDGAGGLGQLTYPSLWYGAAVAAAV